MREFGDLGSDLVDLCYPHGICVDDQDNIYVADTGNFRVMMYDKDGIFLCCPVVETWNYGDDVKPTHVAVTKDRTLLVMMQGDVYMAVHVYKLRPEVGDTCCDCDCEGECGMCCWHLCGGGPTRSEYQPIN